MNIFVVEDERWALAELEELLSCYQPEHQVFAFENGDDALSATERVHPHLVLTDINMPGIDGLELIEQLFKLDSTIKCMILSVHDLFEYARQGMRFGVGDYLLKPVKKDTLYQAVNKAIRQIEKESRLREEWLNGSLTQMLLAEEEGMWESGAFSDMNDRVWGMVLLSLDRGTPPFNSWKDTPVSFDELKRQLVQAPYSESYIHSIDLDCRHKVLLVPLAAAAQAAGLMPQLSRLYEQLQEMPVPAHMGFAVKDVNESLYRAFSRLKHDLEEQMTFGMSSCLAPQAMRHDMDLGSVWDKVRVMEFHYKKGEMAKGQAALEHILTELRRNRITKRQLRLFIQDMLFSMKYNLLTSKNGMVSLNDLQDELRSLDGFTGYTELFDWLKDTMLALYCEQVPKDINPKGLIPVLLQHIHNHYQGTISLQQFAMDHHVSLGYLSRMFKNQTGTTFSDYIASYRIRKAKELLSGGIERLQEVSQLVGYEDVKHFSALFKKLVGETPIMYARKHTTPK